MSNHQAGKGSKQRPTNKKQYDKNFDSISWGDKKKPKSTDK
jgi:hypothetical protein